jgi:hypothetical protein
VTDAVDFLNFINFSFFPSSSLDVDTLDGIFSSLPSVRHRITFRGYTRKVPDVSFFFYEVPRERLPRPHRCRDSVRFSIPPLFFGIEFQVINLRERLFLLPKEDGFADGRWGKKITTFRTSP